MSQIRIIVALLLFSWVHTTRAQTILSGEVSDRANNPIPGVFVNLNDGSVRTTTDADGKFSLTYPNGPTPSYIRFEATTYKVKTMLLNKGQDKIRVILVDSTFALKGVTISVPKHGRFADYSSQSIKMSEFDVVTNPSSMGDLLANMRVMPGVQTNDNDGRLIIQGGNPDESQVYINDLIVVNPYNLSSKNNSSRSRFSPDLFDGIILQSGGYNAEFGQALSGIVNLNTLDKEKMEQKIDLNTSSVALETAIINKKNSYAYRANLSYTNLTPYGSLFPDGYDWHKYYEQLAADFFLTKTFSPKTKMTVQTNLSKSGLNYSYYNIDSIPFNNDIKETYFLAQANVYHSFSSKLNLSFASNVVIDNFSGTDVQLKGDSEKNRNTWNHNKLNIQYTVKKLINRTGVEFMQNPFTEDYTLKENYHSDIKSNLLAFYNDTKYLVNNNLSFSLGLRGEYSTYLKKSNFAPRMYAGYKINRENIISASLGQYYQIPSLNYLKLSNTIDFISATKGTLSYSYVNKNNKFQVDAYYKKYRNLLTYSREGFYSTNMQNDGTGYGAGADIFWKSSIGSLEYWLTYSYNDTKKKYDYYPSQVTPDYLSNHSLNVTLKYWMAPLKSLLGVGYNIASGATYYNPHSPYEQLGNTPFRNRLDVGWSFLPKQWIIIHVACQNVLGYKNVYGYEYSNITPGLTREITKADTRFYYVGVFITFCSSKTINQIKSL